MGMYVKPIQDVNRVVKIDTPYLYLYELIGPGNEVIERNCHVRTPPPQEPRNDLFEETDLEEGI